jgi:hypothetical protein
MIMFSHTTPQQSARILRGQSMIEKGFEPTQIDDNTFQVTSQSGNGLYTVLHKYNAWTCDCPDFTSPIVISNVNTFTPFVLADVERTISC